MKKKQVLALLLIMALVFTMTACGGDSSSEKTEKKKETGPYADFVSKLDPKYGRQVIDTISALGDDPATGNRSAGSPAEKEAAIYIKDQMKEIGLQNVTVDKTKVDGWTYKGANLTFTDAGGNEQKIDLGGYATHIKAKNEETEVVYVGQGTEADYEGVDVKDKLVLIDIDQINEWWITYPAYQAKVKGAKAVLAMSIMEEEDAERLGSQDICGPKDAPALAISQKDSTALQDAIKAGDGKSVKVTFNANSTIKENSKSYNIWGEIPGESGDVVYIISHYDGYYHSSFDDAQGVSEVLTIAKAMVDAGYKPDKTYRFVCHGAEEWGLSNYEADWAIGAWKQITEIRSDWPETAFAVVNMDGSYTVEGETKFGIETSNELSTFTKEITKDIIKNNDYEIAWSEMPNPYREDFGYSRAGIPAVAATGGDGVKYDAFSYHQSTDSIDAVGFDDKAYKFIMELYGKILYEFDNTVVRPMDFEARFAAFTESIDDKVIDDGELTTLIKENSDASTVLTEKINKLNNDYAKAVADKDTETASSIKNQAQELNKGLYTAFKNVQDSYLRLNWWQETIFPHENAQANIIAFKDAVKALEKKDSESALELLYGVEFGYNASAFDKETCQYFIDRMINESENGESWNNGLVEKDYSGVDDVIRDILSKTEQQDTDFDIEITAIKAMIKTQQAYIEDFVRSEKEALEKTKDILTGLGA